VSVEPEEQGSWLFSSIYSGLFFNACSCQTCEENLENKCNYIINVHLNFYGD